MFELNAQHGRVTVDWSARALPPSLARAGRTRQRRTGGFSTGWRATRRARRARGGGVRCSCCAVSQDRPSATRGACGGGVGRRACVRKILRVLYRKIANRHSRGMRWWVWVAVRPPRRVYCCTFKLNAKSLRERATRVAFRPTASSTIPIKTRLRACADRLLQHRCRSSMPAQQKATPTPPCVRLARDRASFSSTRQRDAVLRGSGEGKELTRPRRPSRRRPPTRWRSTSACTCPSTSRSGACSRGAPAS